MWIQPKRCGLGGAFGAWKFESFARMTSQTKANIVKRNDTTPSRKVVEYAGVHGDCVELRYMAQPSIHPTMQRYSECSRERKSARNLLIGLWNWAQKHGNTSTSSGTWVNLLDKNKNGHTGSSSQECRSELPPIDPVFFVASSRIFKSFPVFLIKQAFSLQQCLSGQQCHGH